MPVAPRAQPDARPEKVEREREVPGVHAVVLQRAQGHHAHQQHIKVMPAVI